MGREEANERSRYGITRLIVLLDDYPATFMFIGCLTTVAWYLEHFPR